MLDLSTPYIGTIFRTNLQAIVKKQAAEHGQILAALKDHDPEKAYTASLQHLAPLNIDGTVSPSDAPFTELRLPKGIRITFRPGRPPQPTHRVSPLHGAPRPHQGLSAAAA